MTENQKNSNNDWITVLVWYSIVWLAINSKKKKLYMIHNYYLFIPQIYFPCPHISKTTVLPIEIYMF